MSLMLVGSGTAPLQPIAEYLRESFHSEIICCYSPQVAMQALQSPAQPVPDLLLADISGQSVSGAQRFLSAVHQHMPDLPIVILTGFAQSEAVEGLFAAGGMDVLAKPVPRARLKIAVANALKLNALRQEVRRIQLRERGLQGFEAMIARSLGMQKALHWARRAATNIIPVWIQGEVGTGKEMLARAIHAESERGTKAFVAVSCAAHTETALEMFLAPDGDARRQAKGGTLYLDQAEALPPRLHLQLAQNLQQGGQTLESDVRLMLSTRLEAEEKPSQPLLRYIREHWRDPIIHLPPLRERPEDIPELALLYLRRYSASEGHLIQGIDPNAMQWLQTRLWHANLPELARHLRRSVWMCQSDTLERQHLEWNIGLAVANDGRGKSSDAALSLLNDKGQLRALADLEIAIMEYAVQHHDGCMARAARALEIGRSTLYRRLQDSVSTEVQSG